VRRRRARSSAASSSCRSCSAQLLSEPSPVRARSPAT
jgi:hypothetical protein